MCCLFLTFDFILLVGKVTRWHDVQNVIEERGREHQQPCRPLCWLCGTAGECFPKYITQHDLILKVIDKKEKAA